MPRSPKCETQQAIIKLLRDQGVRIPGNNLFRFLLSGEYIAGNQVSAPRKKRSG